MQKTEQELIKEFISEQHLSVEALEALEAYHVKSGKVFDPEAWEEVQAEDFTDEGQLYLELPSGRIVQEV